MTPSAYPIADRASTATQPPPGHLEDPGRMEQRRLHGGHRLSELQRPEGLPQRPV